MATFRLSRQRCCRRWLWQGLRGLAEAERGHTGTAGGVTAPSGQSRQDRAGTAPAPALCRLQAPSSQSPACARTQLSPRVLTLLLAIPRQRHCTPAARQEGQGGRHQPVHDAALPWAQLQAPVCGGRGALSVSPSPQTSALPPTPWPHREEQPCSFGKAWAHVQPWGHPELSHAGEGPPPPCTAAEEYGGLCGRRCGGGCVPVRRCCGTMTTVSPCPTDTPTTMNPQRAAPTVQRHGEQRQGAAMQPLHSPSPCAQHRRVPSLSPVVL